MGFKLPDLNEVKANKSLNNERLVQQAKPSLPPLNKVHKAEHAVSQHSEQTTESNHVDNINTYPDEEIKPTLSTEGLDNDLSPTPAIKSSELPKSLPVDEIESNQIGSISETEVNDNQDIAPVDLNTDLEVDLEPEDIHENDDVDFSSDDMPTQDEPEFELIDDDDNIDDLESEAQPEQSYNNYNPDKFENVRGVVQEIRNDGDNYMLVMKDPEGSPFYLKKPITNGNMDSILAQVSNGVPMVIQYDPDEVAYVNNNPMYIINDLLAVDLDRGDGNSQVNREQVTAPPEEPEQRPRTKKKKKSKKPKLNKKYSFKDFIKWNNRIGDFIYKWLARPLGVLNRIPVVGRFIGAFRLGKYITRLWLVFILLFGGMFAFKSLNKNPMTTAYELETRGVKINVGDLQYDNNKNTLTATIVNESKNVIYYYTDVTLTKKGPIPFTKKTTECTMPSTSLGVNHKQTLTLKCKGEPIKSVSRVEFSVHNIN